MTGHPQTIPSKEITQRLAWTSTLGRKSQIWQRPQKQVPILDPVCIGGANIITRSLELQKIWGQSIERPQQPGITPTIATLDGSQESRESRQAGVSISCAIAAVMDLREWEWRQCSESAI
ncbi:hypothetical protein MCOR25_008308 [Pyricularia grisea]|nr:hypothetical protein MCOR25_008308 [Pyricularia grisea]